MTPPSPTELELGRLAEKYRRLGELRRARARGEEVPARDVFKDLAAEFPGCLNELDTLPLDEIEARARALARAAEGVDVEAWMGWMAGYHGLLRAALRIKLRVARKHDLDAARAEALALDASSHAGVTVDASFAYAVATPPGGRINSVVFDRLAAIHGVPAATIKRALFPRSRG